MRVTEGSHAQERNVEEGLEELGTPPRDRDTGCSRQQEPAEDVPGHGWPLLSESSFLREEEIGSGLN